MNTVKQNEFYEVIHQDNETSYVTIATKTKMSRWSQYHFKGKQQALGRLADLNGQDLNVYHSNNSFYMPKRGQATLYNLNALYMDLDCRMHDFDYQQALYWLKEEFYEVKVPTPTFTVFTGRGLQLYWSIETAPRQAVDLWLLLQTRIAKELAPISEFVAGMKVDTVVVDDVSRVFRMVGTKNTHTNTVATVVDHYDYRYTMSEIRENYYPDLGVKTHGRKKVTKEREVAPANVMRLHTALMLRCARADDLIKLIELRDGDMKGKRDELLFIYGWTVVSKTCQKERFVRELEAINVLFKEPLSDKEIRYKARHIYDKYSSKVLKKEKPKQFYEHFDTYIFRNDTIIKKLEITEDEQKYMSTIIAKREKYDRNNEKRRNKRRNEAGLTKREQNKADLIEAIKTRKARGLNNTQIAKELAVSRVYVSRLINSKV